MAREISTPEALEDADMLGLTLPTIQSVQSVIAEGHPIGHSFQVQKRKYTESPKSQFKELTGSEFSTIEEIVSVVEKLAASENFRVAQSFRNFVDVEQDGVSRGFFYCRGRRDRCPFNIRFTFKRKTGMYQIATVCDEHDHSKDVLVKTQAGKANSFRLKQKVKRSNHWKEYETLEKAPVADFLNRLSEIREISNELTDLALLNEENFSFILSRLSTVRDEIKTKLNLSASIIKLTTSSNDNITGLIDVVKVVNTTDVV